MADSISKIEIITRKSNFDELKTALNEIGIMGMTVTQVLGCGTQKGDIQYY
ncbi:MAG: P-II family nitrogen regulator, partial [Clostridium butyricum]